jgi:F-type H+-transporting ATPase subunit epsilon
MARDLLHEKLQLNLVTPSASLLSAQVDEVRAPGVDGGFGVRPGHAAFLTELNGGVLTAVTGGHEDYYAVAGGFCEVADNRVTVLADFAEHASSIDPVQAQQELEAAQRRLREALDKDLHVRRREEAAVRNAASRLAAARHR